MFAFVAGVVVGLVAPKVVSMAVARVKAKFSSSTAVSSSTSSSSTSSSSTTPPAA